MSSSTVIVGDSRICGENHARAGRRAVALPNVPHLHGTGGVEAAWRAFSNDFASARHSAASAVRASCPARDRYLFGQDEVLGCHAAAGGSWQTQCPKLTPTWYAAPIAPASVEIYRTVAQAGSPLIETIIGTTAESGEAPPCHLAPGYRTPLSSRRPATTWELERRAFKRLLAERRLRPGAPVPTTTAHRTRSDGSETENRCRAETKAAAGSQ